MMHVKLEQKNVINNFKKNIECDELFKKLHFSIK